MNAKALLNCPHSFTSGVLSKLEALRVFCKKKKKKRPIMCDCMRRRGYLT